MKMIAANAATAPTTIPMTTPRLGVEDWACAEALLTVAVEGGTTTAVIVAVCCAADVALDCWLTQSNKLAG